MCVHMYIEEKEEGEVVQVGIRIKTQVEGLILILETKKGNSLKGDNKMNVFKRK